MRRIDRKPEPFGDMRAAQATASVFAGPQAAALQPPLDLWEAIAFCGYVSWAKGAMIEELLLVRVRPRKHEVMTNRHTCLMRGLPSWVAP